ncbi:hypothetical protein N2152v2_002775 [Parachlorella kessleri]
MHQGHLEAELLAFLRPDETVAQLLARTYVEPLYTGVSLLDNFVSLRPGNVLEIAGAAGTGKTEVLVQVRCHSSFDLLATLAVIKPTITHLAAHGGIRCLLIDNISAFYYLDKVGRPPGGGVSTAPGVEDITREGAPLTLHRVHSGVAHALTSLAREHRVAVMVTKNLLLPGTRDADRGGDMWSYRDFMLKPWQDLVTHRLLLKTLPSRQQQQQHAKQAQHGDGEVGPRVELQHLAKWVEPAADVALRFHVAQGGIVLQG